MSLSVTFIFPHTHSHTNTYVGDRHSLTNFALSPSSSQHLRLHLHLFPSKELFACEWICVHNFWHILTFTHFCVQGWTQKHFIKCVNTVNHILSCVLRVSFHSLYLFVPSLSSVIFQCPTLWYAWLILK